MSFLSSTFFKVFISDFRKKIFFFKSGEKPVVCPECDKKFKQSG